MPLTYEGRRRNARFHARPSQAEDHVRWQHERAVARAHTTQVELQLKDAIDAGDVSCRRLRGRLDEFGMRLDAVHARLYTHGSEC